MPIRTPKTLSCTKENRMEDKRETINAGWSKKGETKCTNPYSYRTKTTPKK